MQPAFPFVDISTPVDLLSTMITPRESGGAGARLQDRQDVHHHAVGRPSRALLIDRIRDAMPDILSADSLAYIDSLIPERPAELQAMEDLGERARVPDHRSRVRVSLLPGCAHDRRDGGSSNWDRATATRPRSSRVR